MINFILRLFGMCLKIFGGLGMFVMLIEFDGASIVAFFLVFYIPGHYLSRIGVEENQEEKSTLFSGLKTYPIGYLSKMDIYSDKIILSYWASTVKINISDISNIEKLGFFDSLIGKNLKIIENGGKVHNISTSKTKEIIDSIEYTRNNNRIHNSQPIQQNIYHNVVQGDTITNTEIKDSVLNRSSVGGGSSKMQELEKLTEMKNKGLIDDDEFKQMKKEILGK